MGASESKEDEQKSELHFTDREKFKVFELFSQIAHGEKCITERQLQEFSKSSLDQATSHNLFLLMSSVREKSAATPKSPNQSVTQQQFSRCLLKLLKASIRDRCHSVLHLAAGHKSQATGHELLQFVISSLHSYQRICKKTAALHNWLLSEDEEAYQRLALCILEDLFFTGPTREKGTQLPSIPEGSLFSSDDLETWLSRSTFYLQIHDQIFHHLFKIDNRVDIRGLSPVIPTACGVDWDRVRTILDFPTLLFLNFNLIAELQTEWRLLFSNNVMGDSFTQLVKHIKNKGPTVLFIRDKGGAVFGGFVSCPWEISSKFQGNSQCFLFSVKPHYGVYMPTGYNDHYMYFNQHVQTLPNGLGMGGQLEYFGLWLDHSFTVGHSRAGPRNTTYGSPQLSSSAQFEVDTVEVWAVGPEKKQATDQDAMRDVEEEVEKKKNKQSILDKDPGAKAMLELIGRGPVSEGLREGDATAHSPEEHNKIVSLF